MSSKGGSACKVLVLNEWSCAIGAGEGALLGMATQTNSAVVSSAHLSALKLQVADMQQLMHPADLQVR